MKLIQKRRKMCCRMLMTVMMIAMMFMATEMATAMPWMPGCRDDDDDEKWATDRRAISREWRNAKKNQNGRWSQADVLDNVSHSLGSHIVVCKWIRYSSPPPFIPFTVTFRLRYMHLITCQRVASFFIGFMAMARVLKAFTNDRHKLNHHEIFSLINKN